MEVWLIKIAQMLFVLMFLVMIHEWGHYITARWFGVRVERFFIFFDVKFAFFKKKIGDTLYGIGWLPLGGYVKLAGMMDESMDKEQLSKEPQPWEFRTKPAWQRLIIMLGGIIVNLLFAIFMYSVLFLTNGESYINVEKMSYGIEADSLQQKLGLEEGDIPIAVDGVKYKSLQDITIKLATGGETLTVIRNNKNVDLNITTEQHGLLLAERKGFFTPRTTFKIDSVLANKEASRIGLQKGDEIVAINGEKFVFFDEFRAILNENKGKNIDLEVNRNGKVLNFDADINNCAELGFRADLKSSYSKSLIDTKKYSFFSSLGRGFTRTFGLIGDQINGIKLLFKVDDGHKHLAGPIGIANQMPDHWDWSFILPFSAFLSAWLAFVNLLPIPAVDGGHAVICTYEIITGKKPGTKFLEYVQMAGLIIMLILMVFIFGNDIFNIFDSKDVVQPEC